MPDDLVAHYKRECNRYVNGVCTTAACLRRGGWKPGGIQNVDAATCVAHETAIALAAKDAALIHLGELADEEYARLRSALAAKDAVVATLRARLAKAEAALQETAAQNLTSELDADARAEGDYEGGFDECVMTARAALDATKEKNDGV